MSAFEYATVRFARENRPQIDCIPQWHASLAVSECFVRVVNRLSDNSSSFKSIWRNWCTQSTGAGALINSWQCDGTIIVTRSSGEALHS